MSLSEHRCARDTIGNAVSLLERSLVPSITEHRSASIALDGSPNWDTNLKSRLYHRAVALIGYARAAERLGARDVQQLQPETLALVDKLAASQDPLAQVYRELADRIQELASAINAAASSGVDGARVLRNESST